MLMPEPQETDAHSALYTAYSRCDKSHPLQVGELRSDNPVVKSKAVVAARELLVTPTKHIQCIAAGITPALIDLLKVRF